MDWAHFPRIADGLYGSPAGSFTKLVIGPNGPILRDQSGNVEEYGSSSPDGTAWLTRKDDSDGNTLKIERDANGNVQRFFDALGRMAGMWFYDANGRVEEVMTLNGQFSSFGYDQAEQLVTVTDAAGNTEGYRYSGNKLDGITSREGVASAAPPEISITYGADSRMVAQSCGGTNQTLVPSACNTTYEIQAASPVTQNTVTDGNGNRTEYQFNSLGNVTRMRVFTNRDVRPGDPTYFETRYEYNADALMTRQISPEGGVIEWTYDESNPDRQQQGNLLQVKRTPGARGGDQTQIVVNYTYEPIYNQVRTITDPRANTTTSFFDYQESTERATDAPNDRLDQDGSSGKVNESPLVTVDPTVLTTEVWLVQELLLTEDTNGLAEARNRLSANNVDLALGDLNADGDTTPVVAGNVVRTEYPTVNLLPGSNQAGVEGDTSQEGVELFTYNGFGQLTSQTDPEGNVTLYEYYPENDPDGDGWIDNAQGNPNTGGYLKMITRDAVSDPARNSGTNPAPTQIREIFEYDAVGNVTRHIDARGVATDYTYDRLNQVVQIRRAAAHDLLPDQFQPGPGERPLEPLPLVNYDYIEKISYDRNGNVVRRQIEDRGNTSNVAGDDAATNAPDLVGTIFEAATDHVLRGQTTVNFTIANVGDQAAGAFDVEVIHSDDSIIGNADDVVLQTLSFAGLAAGQTVSQSEALQLDVGRLNTHALQDNPSGLGMGHRSTSFDFVGLKIDSTGAVAESNERNNTDQGQDIDMDNIVYFPWDLNDTGRVTPTDLIYVINRLNETVQPTDPAAVADLNGDGVITATEAMAGINRVGYEINGMAIDASPPSSGSLPVSAFVDYEYRYDSLDRLVETREQVSDAETLITRYRYDLNGNLALTILPNGTAETRVYDERNLLYQTTRGATSAPALALLDPVNDPTNYDVRGGLAATTTYRYDGNGNLIEVVDADDTDLSAANNSTLGSGDRTRYVYDGFNRPTSVIDSVGNQTVYQYDPAGNRVRTTRFGPVGGPSSTSDGPGTLPGPVSSGGTINAGNLVNGNLLEATEYKCDELSRLYQTDQVLFVNTVATVRTLDVADGAADIGEGNLTPGDNQAIPGITGVTITGRVTSRTEYDRNSRVTFTVEDDGDVHRTFYDGAGRVIKTVDPEGNTAEMAYDDNDNLIEMRETDVSQVAGVADEVFVTTNYYDSLNRLQRTVDNLGQTTEYRYDSRDNLVAVADAQGPMTGASIRRRAFANGPRTVNDVNDFGNVTRYSYDGTSRQIRQEIFLTASGSGDGVHIGADRFGIRNATPTPDTSQGGGDGIIRIGTNYDRNSQISSRVDDQGNVTLYLYDNLNRTVAETHGATVNTTLDKATILGTRQIVMPTAATINNPATISDALINQQLAGAKARNDAVAALFPSRADRVDPPTTVVYGYDPDNNLLIREDENDSELFTRFDSINRHIAERVFRAGQTDSHAGDPVFAPVPSSDPSNASGQVVPVIGTTKMDFQYDGLSRPTRSTDNNDPSVTSDDSVITHAYDSLGRQIEETQQIGELPAQAVSTGWRSENLRSSLTYPNNRVLEYSYDNLDRLNTITDQGATAAIVDYDYIGSGRVLQRLHPINGTRMTYLDAAGTTDIGYDGLGRPVQLQYLRDDDTLIVGFTHTYDRMNNKLSEGKLHAPNDSELYDYDSGYRLIGFDRGTLNAAQDTVVTPSSHVPLQSQWTLDGANNWTQVDGETRQHSSTNEITSQTEGGNVTTVLSDDNGNQTDDGTYQYEWDFQNRLRRVTRKADSAVVGVYAYDASNRRIRKVVTNSGSLDGTTDFYYDGWRVLEERNAADAVTHQYVYGNYIDEVLVMDRNLDGDGSATGAADQRSVYHQNTQYSVFALTDETGQIVEGYLYEPYGRQTVFVAGANGVVDFGGDDVITQGGTSAVDNPYLYTGRRLDAETGLFYYRNRYLNVEQGRFISRDPAGHWHDASNLGNSMGYVGSNPRNRIDPVGLQEMSEKVARTVAGWTRVDSKIILAGGRTWRQDIYKSPDGSQTNSVTYEMPGQEYVVPPDPPDSDPGDLPTKHTPPPAVAMPSTRFSSEMMNYKFGGKFDPFGSRYALQDNPGDWIVPFAHPEYWDFLEPSDHPAPDGVSYLEQLLLDARCPTGGFLREAAAADPERYTVGHAIGESARQGIESTSKLAGFGVLGIANAVTFVGAVGIDVLTLPARPFHDFDYGDGYSTATGAQQRNVNQKYSDLWNWEFKWWWDD